MNRGFARITRITVLFLSTNFNSDKYSPINFPIYTFPASLAWLVKLAD